jgi:predicted PolB exonuclease-like 3'-5' exonuclease
MIVTFDIETLPTNDPSVIAELESSISAPAQYKKPESIAEWMKENKESALKDAVSKTSFSGMYGRIACIGWAIDDGEVVSTSSEDSEEVAITRFFDSITDLSVGHKSGSAFPEIVFCGHNVHGFDLQFLKHRAIILNIRPPKPLREAMMAKKWSPLIADTMLMWSDDPHKLGSMDRLCKVFGIPGKDGFDGSMVAETWPVDPNKVIEYCKDDVERTRKIYKRIMFI